MKRVKSIISFFLIALDMFFLPWLLIFPVYFKMYSFFAINRWTKVFLNYPLFIINFYKNRGLFILWLTVQPVIFVLCFMIYTYGSVKKNKNTEGIGGPESAGVGQHGTSRWQTEKETDETTTVWYANSSNTPKKGGIVLGMDVNKRYKVWLDTEDTHTLIIGTTRSGKSRKCILPTIWEIGKTGESMVITDPKGELFEKTSAYLKECGYKVILLDFREPKRGNRWNLLEPVYKNVEINNIPVASENAWDIAHAIVYQRPQTGEPIWSDGAESVIASLILLVATQADFKEQKHMASVYSTLYTLGCCYGEEDLPPIVEYMNKLPIMHPARAAFAPATLAPARTRASFFTGVASSLRLFADPSIAWLTAVQDHNLSDVGKIKSAVFLVIPDEKSTRHSLASLYIDQTYQALVNLANENKGRLPNRVNFLLDEFGNLPPITDFDKKITVAGGRGMRFTLAIQDLAQLKKHYKESAQTITGNCHTWMYILTTDIDTAKVVSQKTGKYTVETESYSNQIKGKDISMGTSHNLAGRELLLPDEILRWPNNQSLILRARQYPAKLPLPDLSKWPANDEFILANQSVNQSTKNIGLVNLDINIWTPSINFNDDFEYHNNEDKSYDNDVIDSL
ncbi:MAG: type IV secretory system conjugative DNA transfer family protein [Caloramator sp.]|nr:type IV secretory system conjugative DNA transfer family protein [Caloramator sp.]